MNIIIVDLVEVVKFEVMVVEWWDLEGKFKLLYMMNLVCFGYIIDQIVVEFGCDLNDD